MTMEKYYSDCDLLTGKNSDNIHYDHCSECYRYETCKQCFNKEGKSNDINKFKEVLWLQKTHA